jgi:tRNA-modifying protein YgfZ
MSSVDTDHQDASYRALTDACGLVDRGERGKLALSGAGAVEFLNGQVTNELATLAQGQGCYAAFLTHKGKMLGDLRILAVAPEEDPDGSVLLLDTERTALQALFDMIRRFKVGYAVELHKRTLETGLLSLIGPDSRAIAARALGLSELPLADLEHAHMRGRIAGISNAAAPEAEVRLVSTDLGVDLLFASAAIDAVRSALEQAGAHPVDEQAAEVVRVEQGRPRYGIDLDDSVIPQEAGLNERAVNFTKGCYVGQETVARLFYRGKPNRHLRGLRLSEPTGTGAELRVGERVVGTLSSSARSPTLGPIGLALVRREAQPGERIAIGEHGATAEVVELPFPR